MADLKISELPVLGGASLVAADQLAVADTSASETKRITVTDLVGNAVTLIADATIPSAKILFSAGSDASAAIATGGITSAKLAAGSVTAAKLADESTVDLVQTLPVAGAFTGQIALDIDDNKIYVWNGSDWVSVKGAGSVNVVNASGAGIVNIASTTSGDTCTITATLDDTSAAAQFLGGPTGAGGTVGYRTIIGTDLPTPSTSAKGGVIVNGNGLAMSGDTLTINNTVTAEASENHIVQYDANGLVTGGRVISAADVPIATSSTVGVIKPGSGLGVDGAGQVSHNNSITAGTAAKVSFDTEGHITATEALAASDIPNIDASKITTGTFPEARIGSAAVAGSKLKDYAVAQISETTPTAEFTSQFFFNPITRDLFLWDGNVFQPVGISAGEIVLAGTYDASTNLLDSVTADGSAAGFTNGQALPAGAAGNNRHYVVVSQSGNGTAPAPTVALEPPDILLSNGSTYVLIETSETITAQVASNVGFTPAGDIASTNVQAAIVEVDNEKAPKANPTLTGTVALAEDAVLTFEGATDNAFETTLTVTDPTADRTITLPNVTGTVVTTGDTGTVTSTMIVDGAIVNADINAAAEIAVSKLANGTARQLLQTDSLGSGVEFTSNVDVPGTLDVTGAATLDSALGVTGLISANGKVKFPAGTATAPGFYFGTDTSTGLYRPSADKIAITTDGTQRVIVDNAGKVGIGTLSPAQLLSLSSAGPRILLTQTSANSNAFLDAATSGVLEFSADDNNVAGNSSMRFKVDGSERMRINSLGDVGIGDTAPSGKLEIRGASTVGTNTGHIVLSGDSATVGQGPQITFSESGSGSSVAGAYIGHGREGSNSIGFLSFGTRSSSDASVVPAERMRIDSSGNVGIGTSSPTRALHVSSASNEVARIESTSANAYLRFANSAGSGGYIGYLQGQELTFWGNSAERMRIDSSGKVGIGTTSPSQLLHVDAGSGGSESAITLRTTGYSGNKVNLIAGLSPEVIGILESTERALAFKANGAERMRIDSSGNVGIGTTSPGSYAAGGRKLVLASGGDTGLTIKTGATNEANIFFASAENATSNNGIIKYNQSTKEMRFQNYGGGNEFFTFYGQGSERLRIDSSGNVGVGTTSPVALSSQTSLTIRGTSVGRLDLQGAAGAGGGNITGNATSFGINANYNIPLGLETTSTAPITFTTNGNERLRIDSSGRLLAGTTTAGGSSADDFTIATSGQTGITIRSGSSAGGQIHFSDGTSGADQERGIISYQHGGNYMRFYTDATERMRIDSSGNVGIGTSSPNLASGGGLSLYNASNARLKFANSNTGIATSDGTQIYALGLNFHIENKEAGYIATYTSELERLRINSSGQVMIGNPAGFVANGVLSVQTDGNKTISFNANQGELGNVASIIARNDASSALVPFGMRAEDIRFATGNSERMRINNFGAILFGCTSAPNPGSASSVSGFAVNGTGDNAYLSSKIISGPCGYFRRDGTDGTLLQFRKGTPTVGSIHVTGSATTYNTSSDYRLKENVVDISDGISRVKQLLPKRFNFIVDADTIVDGFIAHEAQAVVPEAVTGEKDGEEMQGIDQSKLVPLLTAALQEAIAKIETLEQRLSDAGIA